MGESQSHEFPTFRQVGKKRIASKQMDFFVFIKTDGSSKKAECQPRTYFVFLSLVFVYHF